MVELRKEVGEKNHGAMIEMMSMWEADIESNYCWKHSKGYGRQDWEKEENKIKMSKLIKENHTYGGEMRFHYMQNWCW